MDSPLLTLPGAVPASGRDQGVAWHYGDPFGEQRLAAGSAGWVDRSNRGVVGVTGPDRLTWLHTLLSQHLAELPSGIAAEALLLDPHGRVEDHLQVVDDGVTTWVDVEPGRVAPLLDYLQRMVFWSQVEVDAPAAGVVSLIGPDASAVLTAAEVPAGAEGVLAVRPTSWPLGGGTDLLVADSGLERVTARLAAAGAAALGTWGFEALRVAAGRPRLGLDTDHKTIPHEVGWIETAVHLHKGCYRGQETVARVQNLGRPPRRLVRLHLDGSEVALPAEGAELRTAEGRPVGFVGTSSRHYEEGPVALALVKRSVTDSTLFAVHDSDRVISATVEELSARA